jgi:hypothetical protein
LPTITTALSAIPPHSKPSLRLTYPGGNTTFIFKAVRLTDQFNRVAGLPPWKKRKTLRDGGKPVGLADAGGS